METDTGSPLYGARSTIVVSGVEALACGAVCGVFSVLRKYPMCEHERFQCLI